MKLTKSKLKKIIKEEYQRTLNEDDYSDGFYLDDPDSYAGYITDEERSEFVEAYKAVEQLRRIKPTALPESVEDAIFDMLTKLGIHL
jgi:endo-alpha-1,4-polygalactosaminidase (GH114 family)